MKEVIELIEEVKDIRGKRGSSCFDGFKIITNKQQILLLIDNYQQCYENWGYLMSHDNFEEFIGAEILNIYTTDELLRTKYIELQKSCEDLCGIDGDLESWTIFVTIETSAGKLQFVAYNDHNGYYGHAVKVISKQLEVNETL